MWIGALEVDFRTREDGQVDAHLAGQSAIFNEALADSISSLPPRGASGNGPSTYWIDIAEQGARRAAETGDGSPFASGNITFLCVRRRSVVAAFDYEPDDIEEVSLEDFLGILGEWRKRVLASAAKSVQALPETYRRNPHRDITS